MTLVMPHHVIYEMPLLFLTWFLLLGTLEVHRRRETCRENMKKKDRVLFGGVLVRLTSV